MTDAFRSGGDSIFHDTLAAPREVGEPHPHLAGTAESQPRPALLGRHRRDPGRAPSTVTPPSSPSWEKAGISLSLNF